jgi:deoxycytidylate deaminase
MTRGTRSKKIAAKRDGLEDREGELVLGLVGPVGTDLDLVLQALRNGLIAMRYSCREFRLSSFLQDIEGLQTRLRERPAYQRYMSYMNAGNEARRALGNGGCLALHAIARIWQGRADERPRRRAYVLRSLKHPAEVTELRHVYGNAFMLLGIHAPRAIRKRRLERVMTSAKAEELISRDEKEVDEYGQGTRETFHLADAFVDSTRPDLRGQVRRILKLLFGHPHVHPTFEEHAMFLAQAAAMRSADLSRQVGAVIASPQRMILASGANDVPRAGGGLYWEDDPNDARDFVRGFDANARERERMLDEIAAVAKSIGQSPRSTQRELRRALERTQLADLTEYGRAVHAELDAITTCGRLGVSTQDTTLFTTTFPCHNCAKHIIAAGIQAVVYVEPYPKSKALDLHDDALVSGESQVRPIRKGDRRVRLQPFVGIAPRRFMDFFSTKLGSGRAVNRKATDKVRSSMWNSTVAELRLPLLPNSYLDREKVAVSLLGSTVG